METSYRTPWAQREFCLFSAWRRSPQGLAPSRRGQRGKGEWPPEAQPSYHRATANAKMTRNTLECSLGNRLEPQKPSDEQPVAAGMNLPRQVIHLLIFQWTTLQLRGKRRDLPNATQPVNGGPASKYLTCTEPDILEANIRIPTATALPPRSWRHGEGSSEKSEFIVQACPLLTMWPCFPHGKIMSSSPISHRVVVTSWVRRHMGRPLWTVSSSFTNISSCVSHMGCACGGYTGEGRAGCGILHWC